MRRAEFAAVGAVTVAGVAGWLLPAPRAGSAGAALWLPVAIPVIWACLFLYVPARLAGWWAWREVERVTPRAGDRRALGVVLLLGLGLLLWGIDWGLAGDAWAPDELRPDLVREALQRRFAGGWHDKYPPMHYAVLAIPVSAFELASRLSMLAADSVASHAAQLAMMRLVSVLMGLGTLVAAYLCGAELSGPRRGILAALALLLTPVFLYYGKVANLDMPALCWLGFALLAFQRILRAPRLADYVLLGVSAAAAVATKDQAYASLALLPPAVVFITARRQAAAGWLAKLGAALVDARFLAAAGATVAASIVLHNALFNFEGFVSHFTLLSTLGDLAIVPRTVAGYADLTLRTIGLFRLSLGWPLFVLAVAGVAGAAARRERRWWLWLLLVPLAFHLTFTWVTLYVCDRYLFGGIFVLALFAGSACGDLLESARARRLSWAAAAGALAFSLLYSSSIDVMMSLDARNAARAWVRAHAGGGTIVGVIGRSYVPYLGPPVRAVFVNASVEDVRRVNPGLVVINARLATRYDTERASSGREMLRALEDGSLGYVEVFRYRAPLPAWALLQYEKDFRGRRESVLTNLDKVNPEMVIYGRRRGQVLN